MPTRIAGVDYYLANEAARAAGISKATLLRWIKDNHIKDAKKRDRNGWRLFAETEVSAICKFAGTES
jgi:hypothetical protein